MSITTVVPDEAAMTRLASRLAPCLRARDVVLLSGDLGAGKTTFVRAALMALGVTGDVPSPTFTLVQSYEAGGLSIYHFDLYRLKDPSEIEEIGFDDACSDGLVFVEWPEKAQFFMPRSALALHLSVRDDSARVITAHGDDLSRVKDALHDNLSAV